MKASRIVKTIVLGLVEKDNAVVLGKGLDGAWRFPGGKLEEGESLEDAVMREIMEETGVIVSPGRQLCERFVPQTGKRLVWIPCSYVSGNLNPSREFTAVELIPFTAVKYRVDEYGSRHWPKKIKERYGITISSDDQ